MKYTAVILKIFKPLTEEQVFYDKFLCDKFTLLICTSHFANFFYDKCTFEKLLVIEKIGKVKNLSACTVNKENLSK
jgi:hypothetical protein